MKMKLFFLMLVSIGLTTNTMAQNLSLSHDNGPFAPNETIYIWGDSGMYSTIYCYLHVTNNSASDMEVLMKKIEVNVLAGTENSFCWGGCYGPSVFVSPTSVAIGAAQTDLSSFSGDYWPKGQLGQSTIRYTFFDKNNVNDSVSIIVVYGSGTASVNDFETESVVTAYPNPASTFVNFSFQNYSYEPIQLMIYSATGAEVYRSVILTDNAPLSVDLSNFNSGIYYYSVFHQGQASEMKKLVVLH
ncbi:MAG: T9SS type A sorting domain-containing protein [Bacteroidales bacterium]|jgi:hypothetical protein|nr:T9SS type A sorting domain-containing protein [Bacteroidales bacterium]